MFQLFVDCVIAVVVVVVVAAVQVEIETEFNFMCKQLTYIYLAHKTTKKNLLIKIEEFSTVFLLLFLF